MQFINSNTGWVVVSQSGTGYIMLRTTNQGTNWNVIYSDSSKVGRFQFVNDTLGYAMGYSNGFNLISKTTNSGYNWTIMQSSFGDVYNGFYMVSKDTGWVNAFSFPSNITLRTTNGFQTLEQISIGGGGTPADLYFFKEKYNGEYCGYMLGGYLYKTTNSGYNWQQIPYSEAGGYNSFSFINKDTGWVVYTPNLGNNTKILFTSNSGQNWLQQYYIGSNYSLGQIQALSKNKIYCGSYSYKVLVTTNCGASWGYQNSPIYNNIKIYFYDTLLGFAWANQIVRTTNGGGAFLKTTNISEQIVSEYKLEQNYPNPFNPTTSIKYKVESTKQIKLVISSGRKSQRLLTKNKKKGNTK